MLVKHLFYVFLSLVSILLTITINGGYKDGEIEEFVNHWIRAGWMKWRSTSGVFCDCSIPIKLKENFHKTAIRLAMLYGTKCWTIKKQHVHKISVVEMRMLRRISGNTRKDKIPNEEIYIKIG